MENPLTQQEQQDSVFTCDQCPWHKIKTFGTRRKLKQHMRVNHSGRIFHCIHCKYRAKQKVCLVRHMKLHEKRAKDPTATKNTYTCVLCETYVCHERQDMIYHYVNEHNVKTSEEEFICANMDEFECWKKGVEETDMCRFVQTTGPRKRLRTRVLMYRCFRDGTFRSKSKGVRRLSIKGSVKINGVCPVSIRAVVHKDEGFVHVTFVNGHVGHSNDLLHLRLTKDEKSDIASKLSANVPFHEIIDDIRESAKSDDLQRVHLTTVKDLRNILQSQFCKTKPIHEYSNCNDTSHPDPELSENIMEFCKTKPIQHVDREEVESCNLVTVEYSDCNYTCHPDPDLSENEMAPRLEMSQHVTGCDVEEKKRSVINEVRDILKDCKTDEHFQTLREALFRAKSAIQGSASDPSGSLGFLTADYVLEQ